MRLKTKLVLAIASLVFLISGIVSLVYVSQLLHSAVQQSYDTNRMVADQIQFALRNALETGLRDRKVDPGNPAQLRDLAAAAVRDNAALKAVVDSVIRYSPTVYDINIGDNQSSTLLTTNPDNGDKPLPKRPNLSQLLDANPIELFSRSLARRACLMWWCRWSATASPLPPSTSASAPPCCAPSMSPGWRRRSPSWASPSHRTRHRLSARRPRPPPPGRDQHAARLLDRRQRGRGRREARTTQGHGCPRLHQD